MHPWKRRGNLSPKLGFDAGIDLEARVIRAVDRELDGYWQAPLAAIKSTRGFVVPRDADGHVAARIEISPLTATEPADLVAIDLPERIEPGEDVSL